MGQFTVRVVLDDGRILETPPIDLLPDEDICDVAMDIAKRSQSRTNRFLHIDGGSDCQKLVVMDRIVSVDVLTHESEGELVNISEVANRVRFSLVETPPA